MHDHIVGGIEASAVKTVEEHGEGTVRLSAGDTSGVMLAGHQTTLPVAGVAIAVVGGTPKERYLPGLFVPAQDAIVGNITEQQKPSVPKVYWPFGPACPGPQPLHRRISQAVGSKAGIEDFNGRIGVADGRTVPASVGVQHVRPFCAVYNVWLLAAEEGAAAPAHRLILLHPASKSTGRERLPQLRPVDDSARLVYRMTATPEYCCPGSRLCS